MKRLRRTIEQQAVLVYGFLTLCEISVIAAALVKLLLFDSLPDKWLGYLLATLAALNLFMFFAFIAGSEDYVGFVPPKHRSN